MLLETTQCSPICNLPIDGTIMMDDGGRVVGKILSLWLELRKRVGVVEAKRKPGMKFDTRAADDVYNKIRPLANELGILIYPTEVQGSAHVVEDGTLGSVNLSIICQAVEDGSRIIVAGFGLGADSQDKAGGKAMTYAFKAALLQALLAGGQPDTDDTDTPIKGGVRKPVVKYSGDKSDMPTIQEVGTLFDKATTQTEYKAARERLKLMHPDDILTLHERAKAAKIRCGVE